jgi:hypothetical protein
VLFIIGFLRGVFIMAGANPEGEHKSTILGVLRGGERYLFVFDDASFGETLQTRRRFANNPDLSFSWHDATILGERLRAMRARLPELGNNEDTGQEPYSGPSDDAADE